MRCCQFQAVQSRNRTYVCFLDWQGHRKCCLQVCHTWPSHQYKLRVQELTEGKTLAGQIKSLVTACSAPMQHDPYCSCLIVTDRLMGNIPEQVMHRKKRLGCSEVTLLFVHVLKQMATSAGDGRVLLYDLLRDLEHPIKVLDVCGASAPVHDLAFNVTAPELFATTDRQSVKVTLEVELFHFSNLN